MPPRRQPPKRRRNDFRLTSGVTTWNSLEKGCSKIRQKKLLNGGERRDGRRPDGGRRHLRGEGASGGVAPTLS
jgi:hypothetical protein